MKIDFLQNLMSSLTSGAIFTGIIYLFGKKFAGRWLDSKFEQRLLTLEHENELVIETHKAELNKAINKLTHLHLKEYEVIPEAWSLLMHAIDKIQILTSPLKTVPNFSKMDDKQLSNFIETHNFLNKDEKIRFINSYDKHETYLDLLFYEDLHMAGKAFNRFHYYIIKNSIFLSRDLKDAFDTIESEIWDVWIEMETAHEVQDRKIKTANWNKVKDVIVARKNEIELLIYNKLHE